MSSSNNQRGLGARLPILAAVASAEQQEEFNNELVEDITDEVVAFESDDETEDEDILRELLESAPMVLYDMSMWLRALTRTERQHWDQFVRDLHGFQNALVFLGFDPGQVGAYLGRREE